MKRSCERFLRAARPAILAVSGVLAACGLSRAPSTAPTPFLPFELRVREMRTETIFRAAEDSLVTGAFQSSLGYFGRLQPPRGDDPAIAAVHTDSLEFVSDLPFRFTAHILRDTVEVTPEGKGLAAPTGMLDSDRAMLACLFDGPALRIILSGEAEQDSTAIEDLKSGCAGGLYRRLDLAHTLGAFVFVTPARVTPAADDESGGAWETTEIRPSFSGLGHLPQVTWSYRIAGVREDSERPDAVIEIACDTTLTHLRTVMPNGETADIIADRIRVSGSLREWRGIPFFHQGTIRIEESVRYVRPALGPSVLDKECSVEITLDGR